jgi:hypothetical protein
MLAVMSATAVQTVASAGPSPRAQAEIAWRSRISGTP